MEVASRTNTTVCAVLEKLGSNLCEETFCLGRMKRRTFSAAEYEAIVHHLCIAMCIRAKYPESRQFDPRRDAAPIAAVRKIVDPRTLIFSSDDRLRVKDSSAFFNVTASTPANFLSTEWLLGKNDAIDAFRVAVLAGIVSSTTIDTLLEHVSTGGTVSVPLTLAVPPGYSTERVELKCNQTTHTLNNPYGPTIGVSQSLNLGGQIVGADTDLPADAADDGSPCLLVHELQPPPPDEVFDDGDLPSAPEPLAVRMAAEKEQRFVSTTVMGRDGKPKSVRQLCKHLFNSRSIRPTTSDRMSRFYSVGNIDVESDSAFLALSSDFVVFYVRIKAETPDASESVFLCIGQVEIAMVPKVAGQKTVVSAVHTVCLENLSLSVSTVVVRPLQLKAALLEPQGSAAGAAASAPDQGGSLLFVDRSVFLPPLHLRGASISVVPASAVNIDALTVSAVETAADALICRVRDGAKTPSAQQAAITSYIASAPVVPRAYVHDLLLREHETAIIVLHANLQWVPCDFCGEVFSTERGDFYHRECNACVCLLQQLRSSSFEVAIVPKISKSPTNFHLNVTLHTVQM